MSVTHHGNREVVRCECCSVLDRRWNHLELRQDGDVKLDVKLCRRCYSSVESAILGSLTYRSTDPVPR